ncbi:MAG: gfo/Idh/MocA family oxidoreductase [Chloroflexi bacterium]|nr:MAG: gfo/Idh/MocA family oxidoreductase [Chloroflexota bacterium]
MAEPIRVGVLGLTHDHVWSNLRDLAASPLGTLVGAADPHPELLDKIRGEYGGIQVFADAAALLDAVALDAVYIFGDNAGGVELAELAARRGLHILIEKPMAADLDGADRILAAARNAGVTLMVNWPFAWLPQLQHALEMAQRGAIGRVHGTRYRSAPEGPKEIGCTPFFYEWLYDAERNGAGALMDYCCYGAALARTVLGQPSRVSAMAGRLVKEYITVDDNAVIVMQWPNAMAVAEASWTQVGHLTSYVAVIYGSEGTLLVEPGKGGRLLLATRDQPDGIAVDVPPLPEERRSATAYFLSRIAGGLPVEGLCSATVSRDAQEILEAGLIAATEGSTVSLPLPIYGSGQ